LIIIFHRKKVKLIVNKNSNINVCAVVILILQAILRGYKKKINNIIIVLIVINVPPNSKVAIIKLLKIIWLISNNEYTIKKNPENSVTMPATNSDSLSAYSHGIRRQSSIVVIEKKIV